MLGQEIQLMITDFDGTLVNTFRANYMAYSKAFEEVGLNLSEEDYRRCFGYRYERFMDAMGITDATAIARIKELKAIYYPRYFEHLQVNEPLLCWLLTFKRSGGKIAVASTAGKKNLENALTYIGALEVFDYILAGEDVVQGKPSPEIYEKVLRHFDIPPSKALVFEDSDVGMQAAQNAGINYVVIKI